MRILRRAGMALAAVLVLASAITLGQTRTSFRSMDLNGDGVISRAEWPGNDDSFLMLDLNGDHVLSSDEVRQGRQNPRARCAGPDFSVVDLDGNGRVTAQEWMSAFDRLDVDHDGLLTQAELPLGDRSNRTTRSFQAGRDRGLSDGREAGREDRQRRGTWDLDGQRELVQADAGYSADLGRRDDYQAGYREGFRQGYSDGFGPISR